MTNRIRYGIALAAILAIAAPAAVSLAATTSHAKLFQTKSKSKGATCGIMIHAPKKPAKWILCEANGVPKAKNGVGDPFVRISKTGKPQLILISQASFVGKHAKTLGPGSKWSSLGVTCSILTKTTIKCSNMSGHGFKTGDGHYKAF